MKSANWLNKMDVFYFDMGNTLLDFHKGFTDEEKDLIGLERLRVHINELYDVEVTIVELITDFLDNWSKDFYIRSTFLIEIDALKYLNGLLEKKGLKLGVEEGRVALRIFYSEYINQVVVNPNAFKLLKVLKKRDKRIGVISNCYLFEEFYKEAFEKVGLDQYIDAYTFSYTIGKRKPEKAMFEKALEVLKADPKKSVMIGDSLKADIGGAQASGMKGIWYNQYRKENETMVTSDLEIRDFSELIEN